MTRSHAYSLVAVAVWMTACGTGTASAPGRKPTARPPAAARNPIDAYVDAAATRACLDRAATSAVATSAFARYLDAKGLAGGEWDRLSAAYAEQPAVTARVTSLIESCEDASVIQIAADASVPEALRALLVEELGAAARAPAIDRLVSERWREFTALADPPLLVSGGEARVMVFRAELVVAAREAGGEWMDVSLPAVGVASTLPATWTSDARRGYVLGRPRSLPAQWVGVMLQRGTHVTPDDLRREAKRFLAASGGAPAGTWRSAVVDGMAVERFDGYLLREGKWSRVLFAAVRADIGGVVIFAAVAPARYGPAFAPTFERAYAGLRSSDVVNRTGRHMRDHSPHERQVGAEVASLCPEPASTPQAAGWWKEASRGCPAGSTREESQDGTACWTADRRIVGVRVSVYGDGSPSSYTTYCDGIKHGPAIYFGVSGKVSAEGNFRRGEKHGVWRTYYKTGERKDEVEYRAGQFHGEDKYWNRDGQLVRVKRWRDGTEDPR